MLEQSALGPHDPQAERLDVDRREGLRRRRAEVIGIAPARGPQADLKPLRHSLPRQPLRFAQPGDLTVPSDPAFR